MDSSWLTDLADELARCITDAGACADACEALLEAVRTSGDAELQRAAVAALVAPAAIARVLVDLIDHPPQIVLAACRLCRDSSRTAMAELERLGDRLDVSGALAALAVAADSCDVLLEAG